MSGSVPEFVRDSGGSIATRNVMEGTARLRWFFREPPVGPQDNGWRFLSEIDDDEYLADPENSQFVSFNSVAAIEPAIIPILHLPVGTDIELTRDGSGLHFIDTTTGEEMPLSVFE
jgi:hypothetical protein